MEGHIQRVDTLMTYLRTSFHLSRSGGSILTITERKAKENLSQLTSLLFYILRKKITLTKLHIIAPHFTTRYSRA
jgi:hypothetical protein